MAGTLAACGSSAKPANGTPGQSTSSGTQLKQQANWPLTGLPDGSQPDHPVMVVKIPNTPQASPQLGLGQADLVSEELVEGGITRLAVFYDSMMPGVVGPVRSMRNSDIGLVQPADGVLVSSGAAATTMAALRAAGVTFIQEDPSKGFVRYPRPRVAPYNLMDKLSQTATFFAGMKRPGPYFDFGTAGTTPSAGPSGAPASVPATSIAVKFSGYRTTKFSFTNGHYVNTNAYSGDQPFLADNVIVVRVQEGDAGYRDPAGNPVPETNLTSGGPMTLFHNGIAIAGTWSKAGPTSPFVFKTAQGTTLQIPAGRTYLELCPVDAASGSLTFN